MLSSYEREFQYEVSPFTECKNSIPSSRYSRLSTARYGENRPFSVMLKMSQNLKYFHPKWLLTLPYMGLLSDRQTWGGHYGPPLFFLGNYILYGVLVFIFMYIPINHVCMAIFRLHRFPPAAL